MSEAHPRCRRSHPWWRRWFGCSECSMERLFDIHDKLDEMRAWQTAHERALEEEPR